MLFEEEKLATAEVLDARRNGDVTITVLKIDDLVAALIAAARLCRRDTRTEVLVLDKLVGVDGNGTILTFESSGITSPLPSKGERFLLLRAGPAPSPRLANGWIVRFRAPDVDFGEALTAGLSRAQEYFSDMIGGLRVAHIDDLRRLKFFDEVQARLGLNVNVGSWEEVRAPQIPTLVEIIDEIMPRGDQRIQNLLLDLRHMAVGAAADGCSLGFVL